MCDSSSPTPSSTLLAQLGATLPHPSAASNNRGQVSNIIDPVSTLRSLLAWNNKMLRIAYFTGVMIVAITNSLPAQYNKLNATQAFAPIANAPGVVAMSGITGNPGCADCSVNVPLSFQFPWFRSAPRNSIWVGSNGVIGIDAPVNSSPIAGLAFALDDGAAGGFPPVTPPTARIAVIHGALDPRMGGEIWVLDNGTSVIVSYEAVTWSLFTTATVANAQVEIFANGDIELRYGAIGTTPFPGITFNFSGGLSDVANGSPFWFSPTPLLPEFNGFGQTSGGTAPQMTGIRFEFVSAPNYQLNSFVASLDIDGLNATVDIPAITDTCIGVLNTLNFSTSTPGALGEIAVSLAPIRPRTLLTPGNQVINLDPIAPITWVRSGPAFVPSPLFSFSYPIVPVTAFTASAQAIVFGPGHPDGYSLSQAPQINTFTQSNSTPQPIQLPALQSQTIDFSSIPFCGPQSVPFYGTSYSSLEISPSGRISFGGATFDFSATPSEAQSQAPSFGFWTRVDQSQGGTCLLQVTSTEIRATYSNVPYYNEPTSAISFELVIDTSGTCTIDVSGITANPLSNISTINGGDSQMLGIWPGMSLATDPGPTSFAAGLAGTPTLPTDMIYDFLSWQSALTTGVGLVPSIPGLQTGSGILTFTPTPNGSYTWSGF